MKTYTRPEHVNGRDKTVTIHEHQCASQAELIRVRALLEALGGWVLTSTGEWSQNYGDTMARVHLVL